MSLQLYGPWDDLPLSFARDEGVPQMALCLCSEFNIGCLALLGGVVMVLFNC